MSPDGTRLLTGCDDSNAYLWDTQSGRRQFTLKGHMSAVDRAGFNYTGTLLFTAAWDGTTRIWDPRTGSLSLTIPGMTGLCFGTDADMLVFAVGTHGISLVFAEIVHNKVLRSFVGRPEQGVTDRCQWLCVSGNGRWMASASNTGVRVWDMIHGRQIAFLPTGASPSAVFDPQGSCLVTVSKTGVLRWSLNQDAKTNRIGPPQILVRPSGDTLYQSCFSADGKTLLVASHEQGYVLVLDPDGQRNPRKIGPHQGVRYIALSPDDKWLATGAWRGKCVKIWDLASGELVHDLPIARNASVAFSPDGKWLVTSEAQHIIWRTGTWQQRARFVRNTGGSVPGPIAFSPDGNLLALSLGGPPLRLMLVDLTRLERLATLECPENVVGPESLAFTPDGTRLIFPNLKEGHILYAWDLREIRTQLASMNLDWDLPPYPPATSMERPAPLQVEVDLGELAPTP